jgi:SAM-dependent methyltransferase
MDTRPTAEARVIWAASLLAPGRALDIACGAGRHAIWLHHEGWKVTALDRNIEAIAQIRSEHPDIEARVMDLEEKPLALDGPYDLVICWLYHQRDLYPMIRAAVRPGGIAALRALVQGRFAAEPSELRTWFPGWAILHEEETSVTQTLVCQRFR